MKVLITVTVLKSITFVKGCAISKAMFVSEGKQSGYLLHLRAWGAMADKLACFVDGDKVLVYGSLWNRTKQNVAWLEVDFITEADSFINCFCGIGRVFKQPIKGVSACRFPIIINRTIADKHFYPIASVGEACKLSQSSVSQGDLVQCEGYIDLIYWTDKQGEIQSFLRFTTTAIKQY